MGGPVEKFFRDREIFADLLTRYYTDFDSGATWVVEQDGEVVGYITGCYDTLRYRRAMALRVIPAAVVRGLGRGTFLQRETWRMLGTGVRAFMLEKGGRIQLQRYPAHLHINLSHGSRGLDLGKELMDRFIRSVREKGLQGIHLVTAADNSKAHSFFERCGFTVLGRDKENVVYAMAF